MDSKKVQNLQYELWKLFCLFVLFGSSFHQIIYYIITIIFLPVDYWSNISFKTNFKSAQWFATIWKFTFDNKWIYDMNSHEISHLKWGQPLIEQSNNLGWNHLISQLQLSMICEFIILSILITKSLHQFKQFVMMLFDVVIIREFNYITYINCIHEKKEGRSNKNNNKL